MAHPAQTPSRGSCLSCHQASHLPAVPLLTEPQFSPLENGFIGELWSRVPVSNEPRKSRRTGPSPAQVSLRSDSARLCGLHTGHPHLLSWPLPLFSHLASGTCCSPSTMVPHLCFSTWNIQSWSSLPHHSSIFFFFSGHAVLLACKILVLQRD